MDQTKMDQKMKHTVTGIEAHPKQAKTSKLDGSPIPEEDQIPDFP